MENSKYYITQIKFLVFSISIVLGVYLSLNEILTGNSFKNFIVFFFAAVLVYLIEFSIIQQDALINKKPKLNLANKTYRSRIIFNFLFLPLSNMLLLLLIGITQINWSTFIISGIILTIALILILNHARKVSLTHTNLQDEIGLGPDIQKLVFIFFASIVSYSVLKTIESPLQQFLIYALYCLLIFFISFSVFLYRDYTKQEILFNAGATSYVSMLLLIMIGFLTFYKIEFAVGAYITLIYYININLTDIYNETGKLDTSVLGKYLSMVLLATAVLLLA